MCVVCVIQINKVGMKVRAAIITAVYHKALHVSSTELSQFSTGEVSKTGKEGVGRIRGDGNCYAWGISAYILTAWFSGIPA